ncbi:MAG: hypothetical protein PHW56_08485 [Methanosarcinaceae archaeon]|nr:hypothetical protein [Methanosarcinaceae archaeon]
MDSIDRDFIAFYQSVGKAYGMDTLTSTLFARLFIEPGEIGMSELAEETGYSLASVSNNIRKFELSGLVMKRTKPGTRKIYVEADKNVLKIAFRQFQQFREYQALPVSLEIPRLLEKYEKEELNERQRAKLEILKHYYKDMLKLDTLIEGMLEKLEILSREG